MCVCVCVCVESNESLAASDFLPPPPRLTVSSLPTNPPLFLFHDTSLFPSRPQVCNFPPRDIYVDVLSVRRLWEDRCIIRGLLCMQGVTSCQNLAALLLPVELQCSFCKIKHHNYSLHSGTTDIDF